MNENEENNEGRVSFFISLLTNSQLFTKKFPLTFIWNKCLVSFFFFGLFRVAAMAYGGSQASGQMGAVGAGLRHSHSNVGFKLHLRPTPQLTATQDPRISGF